MDETNLLLPFVKLFGMISGASVRGTVGLILVRNVFNYFNLVQKSSLRIYVPQQHKKGTKYCLFGESKCTFLGNFIVHQTWENSRKPSTNLLINLNGWHWHRSHHACIHHLLFLSTEKLTFQSLRRRRHQPLTRNTFNEGGAAEQARRRTRLAQPSPANGPLPPLPLPRRPRRTDRPTTAEPTVASSRRVLISDRCPVTAGLWFWFTGPI